MFYFGVALYLNCFFSVKPGFSQAGTHFDKVSADTHCVFSESYDVPDRYKHYNKNIDSCLKSGVVSHDTEHHAAAFKIPAGSQSLACQFMVQVPKIENELFSVQWEVFYDPKWQHGGKAFQLECGENALGIELQAHKVIAAKNRLVEKSEEAMVGNYRILHSVRCYHAPSGKEHFGGNGSAEQLSSGPKERRNVQPALEAKIRQILKGEVDPGHVGMGGKAYFVYPGQWVRYTFSWDLSQQPARLKLWIADESTDATLVVADPDDHNLGFICEPLPWRRYVRAMRMPEFNNSRSIAPVDSTTLVRNIVVWRGADVPLGGRPVSP